MRCRRHLSDLSSTIGVCASCLRDRLSLLADQQSINSPTRNPNPKFYHSNDTDDNNQCRFKPPPPLQPALIFPRSVSPYITRRKSDPIPRFHSTPQVGPHAKKKQNSAGKFGLFAKFFGSRSTATVESATVVVRRSKGMSPESECEEEEEGWVMTRPSPARVKPSPSRAASMAFCLSPLVRASPARKVDGGEGKDKSVSSGLCHNKSKGKPSLSEAASFCANRSRKMADFGRLDRKR